MTLATTLHRRSHMLFCIQWRPSQTPTRLFRIQIKRLDFRLPLLEERICVVTKGLGQHYLSCLAGLGQGADGWFWPKPQNWTVILEELTFIDIFYCKWQFIAFQFIINLQSDRKISARSCGLFYLFVCSYCMSIHTLGLWVLSKLITATQ